MMTEDSAKLCFSCVTPKHNTSRNRQACDRFTLLDQDGPGKLEVRK